MAEKIIVVEEAVTIATMSTGIDVVTITQVDRLDESKQHNIYLTVEELRELSHEVGRTYNDINR
jgi:hypothetical protein